MKRGRRSFSVALVGRSLFVMKLGQDIAQLIRDGQADMRGILKQAQPLVGSLMVKENVHFGVKHYLDMRYLR